MLLEEDLLGPKEEDGRILKVINSNFCETYKVVRPLVLLLRLHAPLERRDYGRPWLASVVGPPAAALSTACAGWSLLGPPNLASLSAFPNHIHGQTCACRVPSHGSLQK